MELVVTERDLAARDAAVRQAVLDELCRNPRRIHGRFDFELRRANGDVERWSEYNIVPNVALDNSLDVWLSGGTQDTTWFVGLKGTGSVAAGDTMSSHAGWSEVTAYDEAARQAWVDGGVSGQTVSNSGSAAVFTISANGTTIAGAFLTGDSTKGGTSGILGAVVNFTAGSKTLDDNDTLSVTYTITAADDGV